LVYEIPAKIHKDRLISPGQLITGHSTLSFGHPSIPKNETLQCLGDLMVVILKCSNFQEDLDNFFDVAFSAYHLSCELIDLKVCTHNIGFGYFSNIDMTTFTESVSSQQNL
jgi:hypothetical protein